MEVDPSPDEFHPTPGSSSNDTDTPSQLTPLPFAGTLECTPTLKLQDSQDTEGEYLYEWPRSELLPVRASQRSKVEYLTTGCPFLDKFLKGGFDTEGITEICGEAGVGKTQFCLQLCLNVQLSERVLGFDSGAVVITTDNLFPSKRVAQLGEYFRKKYDTYLPSNPMDRIMLEHHTEVDSLMDCLTNRLPLLIERSKSRLLIIDSIAPIFRAEFTNDPESQAEKAKILRQIVLNLRRITREYRTIVVITNQLSGDLSSGEDVPSLGLSWSNCVSNRFQLLKGTDEVGDTRRILRILFSPRLPPKELTFDITSEGVRMSDKEWDMMEYDDESI